MISKTLQLSNNSVVHYLEEGNGEPLVLIHGVGMQASAWYPQIDYFSKNYKVFSVDMPGHGESAKLPEGSQLPDFVDWAINFITELNVGPVNLAGHSMGSLITIGVYATRPDLVKRIAILNGVYKRTPEARNAVIKRANELHNGKLDIETPLKRWFGDTPEDERILTKVKSWLNDVDIAGYATAYNAFAHGDDTYADAWSKVSCPALVLTGEKDNNSSPVMAKEMASRAINGKDVIIQNERHMVNLTSPEKVNTAMEAWLNTKIN